MKLAARFTPQAALAITVAWVAVLAISGSTDALLFMAPALLIVFPLLQGRYVGEELIAKLNARRGRRRQRPTSASPLPIPPAPEVWLPRGTRLIAFGLAKRPPPTLPIPQS